MPKIYQFQSTKFTLSLKDMGKEDFTLYPLYMTDDENLANKLSTIDYLKQLPPYNSDDYTTAVEPLPNNVVIRDESGATKVNNPIYLDKNIYVFNLHDKQVVNWLTLKEYPFNTNKAEKISEISEPGVYSYSANTDGAPSTNPGIVHAFRVFESPQLFLYAIAFGVNDTIYTKKAGDFTWQTLEVATTTSSGKIRVATQGEVDTGVVDNAAVTPKTLKSTAVAIDNHIKETAAHGATATSSPNSIVKRDANGSFGVDSITVGGKTLNANGYTGNSTTSTTAAKLQTPRKINGVAFDGTADIDFSANTYVSPSHGASAGSVINYNHNLNIDPSRLSIKIIATVTTAHAGWNVGDKVIAPISSNLYISGAAPNLREHGIVCMLTNNTVTAIHGNLNDLTYIGRTGVVGQNLLRSNCSFTITINKI